MIQQIDIFLPCIAEADLAEVQEALNREKAVRRVWLVEQPIQSSATIQFIADNAQADFVLLSQKTMPVTLGQHALERLLRVAMDTEAAMVYADHYSMVNGKREAHPVIDYQEGSIRDDFDFGQLLLIRTALLREFVKEQKTEYAFAALYSLRLFLQRHGAIFHLNEYLYTEEELDTRKSGEKQFDYVNPRNR
jgi:hypothetical protein